MMERSGTADLLLLGGRIPAWLASRMMARIANKLFRRALSAFFCETAPLLATTGG
jgi:hypothetical protein